MKYSDKLKDPRWQRKRLEILHRDEFACVQCGCTNKTLHVHHGVYQAGREPWEADDDTLWTLCEDCHDEAEDILHDIRIEIGRLDPSLYRDLFRAILDIAIIGEYSPVDAVRLNETQA